MKKITHADIAGELCLSRATITRVLRNDPCVRKETRKRVVDHLNRIGYYNQTHSAREKILFSYQRNPPMIRDLLENLKKKPFFRNTDFVSVNIEEDRSRFLKEVESASILVIFGIRSEKEFLLAREANPDLYIIHALSGGVRFANISIEPDNTTSGRLAAEYVYNMGHRTIMTLTLASNPSSLMRVKSFASEFLFRFPQCRITAMLVHGPDLHWEEKLLEELQKQKPFPTAIVCFGCSLQNGLLRQLKKLKKQVPEEVSILSHDNPSDFNAKVTRNCDAVVFELEDILHLVEYFIVCRPLAAGSNHLSISPELRIERHGTVKPCPGTAVPGSSAEEEKSEILIHATYP